MNRNDCSKIFQYRINHIRQRALEAHGVVLDVSDINKLLKKIRKKKFMLLRQKDCRARCSLYDESCRISCLLVIHKNKDGQLFGLPLIYCKKMHQILTVLRKNCYEFIYSTRRLGE